MLMYATMKGHTETVNVLVAAGADLNTQDRVCMCLLTKNVIKIRMIVSVCLFKCVL